MHDFLDRIGPAVVVCTRCGLAEFEPGWDRCFNPFVAHQLEVAARDSIVRNPKTGRIMLIERAK